MGAGRTGGSYLQSTVLIASDLVVAVAVTIEGGEHDTERSSPLAEEDEEVMSQRLLREEEAPVVDWTRMCVCDLNAHL